MADIIYHVNEPLGVVIARMPNFVEDMHREFESFCNKQFTDRNILIARGFSCEFYEKARTLLADKYEPSVKALIGKATCNFEGGEVFDLEKGKELAKQRLIVKVFKLRYNILREVYEMIFDDFLGPICVKGRQYVNHLAQYEENLRALENEY